MALIIESAVQMVADDAPGVLGNIHVKYKLESLAGPFNIALEYKDASNNWYQCWDCIGSVNSDVVTTTATISIYWQSPEEQQPNVERTNVGFRIIAFQG